MEKRILVLDSAKSFIKLGNEGQLDMEKSRSALALWPVIEKNFLELSPSEIGNVDDVNLYAKIRHDIHNFPSKNLMGELEYKAYKSICGGIVELLDGNSLTLTPSQKKVMCVFKFNNPYFEDLYDVKFKEFLKCHFDIEAVNGKAYHRSSGMKMQKIFEMISESQIVIVDLSIGSPNIFIELGISFKTIENHHLFFVCKRDHVMDDYNPASIFDIEGRDIIFYDNFEDLMRQLLKELVGAVYSRKVETPFLTWDTYSSEIAASSSKKFSIRGDSHAYAQEHIQNPFMITARVELAKVKRPGEHISADLRIHYSESPTDNKSTVFFISPWSGNNSNVEFHVTSSPDYQRNARGKHTRISSNQIDELSLQDGMKFTEVISINDKTIVFEILHRDISKRLVCSIKSLSESGVLIDNLRFIGIDCYGGVFNIEDFEVFLLT